MKKQNQDKDQVAGYDRPGGVVNFFDPYPDEDKVNYKDAENGEEETTEIKSKKGQ
ncbi:hypothetical protein AAEO50_12910 [Rossellomorea oryzaecorticis]|uniref:Uncharacterized protein n=1 Tax=Rossellomorea oryzaecorticis TaxID=1396505 RepID=A0ABU9KAQ4_9BACI